MKRIEEEIAAFSRTPSAIPNPVPVPGRIPPPNFGWNFTRPEQLEMQALRAPPGITGVNCSDGQEYRVDNDGIVKVPAQDVPWLLSIGFKRP
jgi:hypothetical protein